MKRECCLEADALCAALQSRWPDRLDQELRAHIESCPVCADVVTVAGGIGQDREKTAAEAVIPDSGRVWWLAQMRARREDARAAVRPIATAQWIAFASAVGLLGACFGATSAWFQAALRWLATSVDLKVFLHPLWAIAAALVILGVPTAVYFAMGRE
jgi:hypothetical protein